MEAEVIKLFESKSTINTIKKKPQQPETIQLINKLISEYMDWMGYKVTNTIFMTGMCDISYIKDGEN